MHFTKKRGGRAAADVSPVEAALLEQLVGDLLTLLGEADPVDTDPLAAMVGLSSGTGETPEDPAVLRLLPDAYGDDAAAATEFRRLTEDDLRADKRHRAGLVLADLPRGGGRLVLDRDGADAWLGTLNDLRLVLGTRLEVGEEEDPEEGADTARGHALQVYGWLGWLQESLIGCLSPRRG